jgi:hypothetical protein
MKKEDIESNPILKMTFEFFLAIQYWLMLCSYSKKYPECNFLLLKLEEIQKVLNKNSWNGKEKNSNQLYA